MSTSISIIRNSAKCNTCDVELESTHRHDFRLHTCPNKFEPLKVWVGNELREKVPREQTFNWGVDGGQEYVRRLGSGFTETSILDTEGDDDGEQI